MLKNSKKETEMKVGSKNKIWDFLMGAVFLFGFLSAFADEPVSDGKKEIESVMENLSQKLGAEVQKIQGLERIAVVKFANLGRDAMDMKVGEIVTELLGERLKSNFPNIKLVEREKIDAVLEEMKLSLLGITEGENAKAVGNLLEAQAIVTGSVNEIADEFVVVSRLIEVSSGKVLLALKTKIKRIGMVALSEEMIVKRTRVDSLYRSLVAPGWGQFYNRQAWKAYIIIGLEAVAVGGAVWSYFLKEDRYDKYKNATSTEEAQRYYDKAERYRVMTNAFIYSAIGVWALNVIDAVVSGKSEKRLKLKTKKEGVRLGATIGPEGSSSLSLEWRF